MSLRCDFIGPHERSVSVNTRTAPCHGNETGLPDIKERKSWRRSTSWQRQAGKPAKAMIASHVGRYPGCAMMRNIHGEVLAG